MFTKVLKISDQNKEELIKESAKEILAGNLVVFPTETVYGLGANVFDEEALKKIYLAKGRPSDNPIIVHVSDLAQLHLLVEEITPLQKKMIESFWPGPLTIIFQKKKEISNIVSGGLTTIAIRMPKNDIALELIKNAGVPIAAPSANISGRPSGTSGVDVSDELDGKVKIILVDKPSKIGVESTVIKEKEDSVFILRPGGISKEMIEEVLPQTPIYFATSKKDLNSSPGTRYKHYAPKAKLEIVSGGMREKAEFLLSQNKEVGIITTLQKEKDFKDSGFKIFILGDENNLSEISQNLYKALRFFDDKDVDIILCPSFEEKGIGVAIMDRLRRASI